MAHELLGEYVSDVFTTFWRLLWSITQQTQGNMESMIYIIKKQKGMLDFNACYLDSNAKQESDGF